jgi:hypothetical protein
MKWIPLIGLLIYTLPTESVPTPHNDLFDGTGGLTTTTDVARLTSTRTWLGLPVSADLNVGKRSVRDDMPGYNPEEYTNEEQEAIERLWTARLVFKRRWPKPSVNGRCQPTTIPFSSK